MAKPGQNAPTPDQMTSFVAADWQGPVCMINLLKFRDQADYGADIDEPPCTGREAYTRYGELTRPFLAQVGGQVMLRLAPAHIVIGDDNEDWDLMMVVQYPSHAAFIQMASNPDYLAVTKHRSAALERSALIASHKLE